MTNTIDPKIIGKLAEILNKSNLSELEYEDEGCRIHLKGALAGISVATPTAATITTPAAITTTTTDQTKNDENFAIDDYSTHVGSVKSPIVGVVYLAPDPTKPDYVNVGDNVKEGDIVCLIEAMKTFNPVKAHRSGTVTKILVESGDPVEYGESFLVIE